MKFGRVRVEDAVGAMLAHATVAGTRRFRKAHRLTSEDIAHLEAEGISEVVAAILAPEDLDEDAAAARLAEAMLLNGIEAKPAATGRVNLHALHAGVFTVEKSVVDRVNSIDPAMTLATVAAFSAVERGDMVATIKIIPFAVDRNLVERAASVLTSCEVFSVHPFRPVVVGCIQTLLPRLKSSILDKTMRVMAGRLARSGSSIGAEIRVAHDAEPLSQAIASLATSHDMVVVFGASALCDFDDVIPAAIRLAGGEVLRTGMPVDPGNLLVLGRINEKPLIGAPGCARSPKENGFDWILDRLIAGIEVTNADIAGLGVGGLLMEIPTRPQPRDVAVLAVAAKVYAIVLAAGRSSRMGGPNKLMAQFSGHPLIRQTVERVLASRIAGTVVVTGHQASRIGETLLGLDAAIVQNDDFATGLSSSVKTGVAALPEDADGVLIMLGDMPAVSSVHIDRLVLAFRNAGGRSIVRATHEGKRGNPVILPRALFGKVFELEGDTGARHLVEGGIAPVVDVEIGEGASIDVDTKDALERAGGVLQD
ncbi:MAG: molybdopterin-binding/glycosyltransferase family 2 protein [Rhizobiaceae bacterium]|nr:molybdopterin-binding/glycosyltransferase family 2 protein [Rhizobiaceae bacterium]